MAKSSPARRQPARTATPEELADETARAEQARRDAPAPDEHGDRIPPKPDPELAREVHRFLGYDSLGERLRDGRWIPSTPAELAAAFQLVAGELEGVWDVECNSDPSLHSLREHVLALESLIVGRDIHWLADLDGDPAESMAGRAEFQRLYQQFEQRRRAGEEAGLHQRLREAEARIAQLESRLSTSRDWSPDPDDLAEGFLWERGRVTGGPYIGQRGNETKWEVTGFSLVDLSRGTLRPRTWAQLLDCLQLVASEVAILVK